MTNLLNRKILLASRPVGMPDESNFQFIEENVPELQDGEVLIRSYICLLTLI